ncbi:protein SUBSTANDARD STARCH GRAIN 4, chloroplastic isoform X1 [Curcuma longa]|uniref:protein SUBSTANDARD STARCH GRAIN 4, chloroplastic isoform X1 n=2 Tax=Curcuma longa TaxID=136217 RepID=UPI003D9E7DEF
MSADCFRSSFLGSPLRTSLTWRNGSAVGRDFFSNTSARNRRKGLGVPASFSFSGRFPGFSSRKIGFLNDGFRVNCFRESVSKTKGWIRSLNPPWKEGLFFIRCSVFVAVISMAGMLMWYAQRKASSFVETHLLPTACSILREHLQRELDFGKVRCVSPLGITLDSCSIGPHKEEFSCGEVTTMKLRLRPFASLRRGKIVIDAILFQPCLLVAQKEDFSWLGIPSPSGNGMQRHHSSEEGIDYRTKTRRIAREESAASWARKRIKAAKEAAETGYIVPEEDSSVFRDEDIKEKPPFAKSRRPSSHFCIDDHMHSKDHHCMDNSVHGYKHAESEKFSASSVKFSSKIIPEFLRHRFKRNGKGKVVAERGFTSKQRTLKRSAVAALAYLRAKDDGKFSEPSSSSETHSSSEGNRDTGPELTFMKDKENHSVQVTPTNEVERTKSEYMTGLVYLDEEFRSQTQVKAADGNSAAGNFDVQKDNEIHTDGSMEKHQLAEDSHSSLQFDACTVVTSKSSSNAENDDGLEKHHLHYSHDNGVGFDTVVHNIADKSGDDEDNNSERFSLREFGTCTQMHQSKTFHPFTFRPGKVPNNALVSQHLASLIQKLMSFLSISYEDLSPSFFEDVTKTTSIKKALPVTLDSVHYAGGTLMFLGFGDIEPREMIEVNGRLKLDNYYSGVHVQLSGNCKEWRKERTCEGGGDLSADVFVNILEQNWHANLKIINLFAPLFERILELPLTWSKGRATGEIHICMSRGDSFPSLHGQLDVNGLSFCILDSPSAFSELTATLCFRGQRIFLHNASGWFGDAPLEASGDFGINPENGEFHLMCQVPSVEVNALMKTLRIRPLLFPVAGSVTAIFNCQGPLDAPILVGSGIISRKFSKTIYDFPPSSASEAVIENKEAGAVAAFDRIPFSHASANFTFNLDNYVADLYGIRACLLDDGEIRGAGSIWICPEGEVDDTAMDVNFSGNFLLDKVLHRYLPKDLHLMPLKIGELNGETRLSGSFSRPRFDIKWVAPKAEDSFGDARGDIIITHDNIIVTSSSVAFDLFAKVQTSYRDDYLLDRETMDYKRRMPLIVGGVDLNLRLRDFEMASFISSNTFESPRSLHLKATGKVKFQGRVVKTIETMVENALGSKGNSSGVHKVDRDVETLVGDVSLSGISVNQLMLAPQLTGSLSISREVVKLSAAGRPDENLLAEVIGPFWFSKEEMVKNRRSLYFSLQKGQIRANIFYQPQISANLEVRNLPLDELELASLRGTVQKAELQLNFQKRRGHGLLSVLRPKFSGVLGQAFDVAARWTGDVITVEKTVLEQASSRYELQGEYVLPGTRDRYTGNRGKDGMLKKVMAGHLGSVISSMGRWRIRLEVPYAEVAEMLPLARLLSRSTDPAVQSRSKDFFMQSLQSVGFHAENLRDHLKAIQNFYNRSDEDAFEDITLPGLAEFKGRWNGSLDASGGGNGDTMADFDFHGEDWEWGNYKTQRILAVGAYSNLDGLRLEKLFIQKDNATLHADGTLLGPVTNLHFAVLNFPVGLVPMVVQIIESSTFSSIQSLRQWLTPIKGILHMEGDLKGSLAKPECDVKIRLLDGTIGGIDLGKAELVASITSTSRFVFNANFEPTVQSGHVHIQGSVPVTYVVSDAEEDNEKERLITGGAIKIPVWVKETARGSSDDITEKKVIKDKTDEGWDFQLAESLKGLNWNMLDASEVRINADIKDGGMTLITALSPYANWLHGYADIMLQVKGTVEQPIIDGSASFHRATVSSPVLKKPLSNLGGTLDIISNRLFISSIESRVSRKGKLLLKGNLPLKNNESSSKDKIDLKCEVLEVRAKNIFSGQVDSQMQIMGSILQPNILGTIQLSRGEAYLPHDKGNGAGSNKLAAGHFSFPTVDYNQVATSGRTHFVESLSDSSNKWPQSPAKEPVAEKKTEENIFKPLVDVRLTNLKLTLGPELRIVYPLILNFAVSGELELDGMAHPKYIRPKGILTFENGDVNLVATQARLKRDHLNIAKFEPDLGLDPILDLALMGSEWQFRIQSRASTWQDNLVVTSTRSVDQDALTPTEAARVFESQLAESLLEGDGQLAFKKLATATLETLMPRIEGKGEFGHARWRVVYAPRIPSLLSLDPTVDPLKSLANNLSFGTEVEVQLGKRLQASVVRQMKDSEIAMQWTLMYQLTSRLRVLFQSAPSNRLLFEYTATSQD